jgi:hypothetical protein
MVSPLMDLAAIGEVKSALPAFPRLADAAVVKRLGRINANFHG